MGVTLHRETLKRRVRRPKQVAQGEPPFYCPYNTCREEEVYPSTKAGSILAQVSFVIGDCILRLGTF